MNWHIFLLNLIIQVRILEIRPLKFSGNGGLYQVKYQYRLRWYSPFLWFGMFMLIVSGGFKNASKVISSFLSEIKWSTIEWQFQRWPLGSRVTEFKVWRKIFDSFSL